MTAVDPAGPIGGAAARQAAINELTKSEYHRDDPNVLERGLDWIGRHLSGALNGSPSGSATLVLLVFLLAVVIFAVVRAGRPRRLARAAAAGADPLAAVTGIDHYRRAAEFEAQGQLAEALREWVRATVAIIEDRGVLDPRPGRTGAALAREAGAVLPEIAAGLNSAVDSFEQVWFGRRPATAAEVRQAHASADAARTARIEATAGVAATTFAVPR